jgi:serine/threonine-protein kinase
MEYFSVDKLPREGKHMVDNGDRAGRQFGQYHILQPIGQGALADVYMAEHADTTTKVAIKILHTELSDEEVENFITQAGNMCTIKT